MNLEEGGKKIPGNLCRGNIGQHDPKLIGRKHKEKSLKCCDWHCTTEKCRQDIKEKYDNNKC